MAQKLKHKEPGAEEQASSPRPVVNLPTHCKADGCKKKSEKLDFCSEHYDWFKWGLISREGKRPIDFDKKYDSYMKHTQKHKKTA